MSQTAMIILGFSVIFLATTAGSAIVWFFKRDISDKVNTLFLGFASGLMVAASVWSLIIPSIEGAESWGKWNFVPALIGFLLGGLFLVLLDHVVPHFHNGTNEEEGPRSSLKKSTKMFLAVTIHNIPEGLAVERRGRRSTGRPKKQPSKMEEDLLAEVQRLRAENAYLKNLQALVLEEERRQRKKRR